MFAVFYHFFPVRAWRGVFSDQHDIRSQVSILPINDPVRIFTPPDYRTRPRPKFSNTFFKPLPPMMTFAFWPVTILSGWTFPKFCKQPCPVIRVLLAAPSVSCMPT
ncbi:hypothetical protein BDZ89DRAFT_20813 [Hymenopellis radicata]|nr:hypothetical protein BDZ89DRAFT_20813 [Hymenopellis radicata]